MTPPPRVVFLGNHTVGVRTLNVLAECARLVGVVAHPEDPEDGLRYESVFDGAKKLNIPAIRSTGKNPELASFVSEARADLLWISDYRYLLPQAILKLPRLGAVNLHPSLLPKYRGRAPINWAILNGETRLGLTAHWVDAGMDTGDIIAQRSFDLRQDQDVGDALEILYPIYESITREVISAMRLGEAHAQKQDDIAATVFPKRTPSDGLIDWARPAREVWNLVRAVAPPYPGAFAPWHGSTLWVHRISRTIPFPEGANPTPGSIVDGAGFEGRLVVACDDCCVEIEKFALEPKGIAQ